MFIDILDNPGLMSFLRGSYSCCQSNTGVAVRILVVCALWHCPALPVFHSLLGEMFSFSFYSYFITFFKMKIHLWHLILQLRSVL